MSKKKKSNKIIRNNPKNLVTGKELIESGQVSKSFHLKDYDIIGGIIIQLRNKNT